jgi:hypothetical protein
MIRVMHAVIILFLFTGCGLFSADSPRATLEPPRGTGGLFGSAVATDGDRIVVGASFHEDGRAYVFESNGTEWTRTEKLRKSGGSRFGSDVAISGDRLAVGSFLSGPGSIELRYRNSTGAWAVDTTISAHGGVSEPYHLRGPLTLSGDRLMAFAVTSGTSQSPTLVVFWTKRNGTWEESGVVRPPDASSTNRFGRRAAWCGDRLYLSEVSGLDTPGRIYMYESVGDEWVFVSRSPGDPGHRDIGTGFGTAMACNGEYVLVGSRGESYESGGRELYRAGAAYLYSYDEGDWAVTRLTASDANDRYLFGTTVAMTDEWAFISSYRSERHGGTVHVFRLVDGQLIQTDRLTEPSPDRNHFFGDEMAVADNLLVVGAHGHARDRGAAYVYRLAGENWVLY